MTEQELLGYLRDAAQGASNSAASTVSGPVDLLAWMLRKGGVPVGDAPVMGSEWMAQKGLTAQPQNALAGMAGETIGNISPIVAAAKAPQIANALLRVGENAAARPMLNPQTGAIVWHGSPHKFDKFDSSKIGTGEGAQAYGHGLYLADAPDVANAYAGMRPAAGQSVLDGKPWSASTYAEMLGEARARGAGSYEKGIASLEKDFQKAVDGREASVAENFQNAIDALRNMQKLGVDLNTGQNLYKVDLPDEHIARMLDWDKPLSQQAPGVRDAMSKAFPGTYVDGRFVDPMQSGKTGRALLDELGAIANKRGAPGFRAAEPALGQAGIPGIRYLDGGSRGAGAGTSNYVVFPGEENALLRILERNGVPIGQ